jgi:hypothetical protein
VEAVGPVAWAVVGVRAWLAPLAPHFLEEALAAAAVARMGWRQHFLQEEEVVVAPP